MTIDLLAALTLMKGVNNVVQRQHQIGANGAAAIT